ncbi:MAG: 30S ribosomal protein S8 [Candidatus Uhrbacteria bacterium]|nr:30S ribosomal protein S8 [Candidatus Uhrbacteria bacterium]
MMTDPISDMLTRIRNASLVRAKEAAMPASKIKFAIAKILQSQGYLSGVETYNDGARPMLKVRLAYSEDGQPAITSIARASKPSRRIYVRVGDIESVRSGHGCAIISTPNGLMTNSEARKRRLGGELICEVY